MINKQSLKTISISMVLLFAIVLAGCSSSNIDNTVTSAEKSLILAQLGQHTVELPEFEEEYAQSVGNREMAAQDSLPAYEEFLDRYVDFKLKVLYAKELGLHNDSTLNAEIEAYRQQLARPYLLEKEILDPILQDLYQRQQMMVNASHILVRLGKQAPQEEIDRARAKMEAIQDSIRQGIDFGDLAYRNSEDPSARGNRIGARGHLGNFIGGQMVKDFEDRAYSTPVDSVSDIFRSDFGFHILKVHERGPKMPDVYASHIAVRHFKPSTEDTLNSEQRIEQIKQMLDNGADFAALAKEKSEDKDSGLRGGQLGRLTFTQQGMPDEFKDALFKLKTPGEYSDVIRTDYGYHIIKLDQLVEPETFEQVYDKLKAHAARLPRMQKAEKAMALQIREKYGTSVDTSLVVQILDGKHFTVPDIHDTPEEEMQMVIASIGESTFKFEDVVDFAETASIPFKPDSLDMAMDAIERFLTDKALDYEAARLETRDDEFRGILTDFKDGLLLFKLMEDSVWTAAAQDTAGLMAYHAPRADSFWFDDRHRIVSFSNPSDSILTSFTQKLDDGTKLASLISMIEQDTTISVRIDTTYLSSPNNSIYDKALDLKAGEYTQPARNNRSYMFMVNTGIEPARQKTFTEARSEVLNLYQNVVEQELLDMLRSKYKAKKYKERLPAAFAADKKALENAPKLYDNMMGGASSN